MAPPRYVQQSHDHTVQRLAVVGAGADRVIELEPGWGTLKEGLTKLVHLIVSSSSAPAPLHEQQLAPAEYSRLYTTIFIMCTQKPPHNYSQQLYHRAGEFLRENSATVVLPAIRGQHGDLNLLKEIKTQWDIYKVLVTRLVSLFAYLETVISSQIIRHHGRQLLSMGEAAMVGFREATLPSAKEAVVALINREREGGQIDRAVIKNVISIFVLGELAEEYLRRSTDSPKSSGSAPSIQTHELDVTVCLLDNAAEYYRRKACGWMENHTCVAYMLKAEECMRQERERVAHYLYAGIEGELLSRVQQELLCNPHIQQQLLDGCRALLSDGKVEDLARMYRLFCNVDLQLPSSINAAGLDRMVGIFGEHLADATFKLLQITAPELNSEQAQVAFVQKLVDLQEKYSTQIVDGCFAGNPRFYKVLREGFSDTYNKRIAANYTAAELLATYCDHVLKGGGSWPGSTSTTSCSEEDTLEMVLQILAYVSDKDLFSSFFRRKLARRWLSASSSGDASCVMDLDRSFLAKLKQQCGPGFTTKMEGMLKDVTLAKENEASFRNYINMQLVQRSAAAAADQSYTASPNIDLRVTTLTTVHWPTQKPLVQHLALPAQMAQALQTFNDFYHQARTGRRKLTWLYSLGTCHIVGKFQARDIELIVTTLQASVLLLFDSADMLSYSEIKSELNLTDADDHTLTRVLHSLSCGKYKILTKHQPTTTSTPSTSKSTSTVGPDDSFECNAGFSDKKRRIKIPPPPLATAAKDEKKTVIQDVDKERRYVVDACLVRIMKSRKALAYQQLVVECVQQLQGRFTPDIKFIKKRIEDLVHREYMKRDADDPNLFTYVA